METPGGEVAASESWFRRTRIRVGLWILKEASTLPGAAGIVTLAFIASALVPIALEPFILILTTNLPHLWRRFALCFAAGSILGGVAGYAIGHFFLATFGLPILRFWGEEDAWNKIQSASQSAWWLVPVAAVAVGPGPMKLVAMAAGAARVSFVAFLAILTVGRLARFFAISWLAKRFGQKMHDWYVAGRHRAVYIAVAVVCLVLFAGWMAVRALVY